MQKAEIRNHLEVLSQNFNKESFIYDFLLSFGLSKTTITRLQKGDFNLSKVEGEVFHRRRIFFKEVQSEDLIKTIDLLSKDQNILKYQPRFILLTDYKTIVASDTRLKTNIEFDIEQLAEHVDFFLPLSGAEIYRVTTDNKADRDAAYRMGELYDLLISENEEWVKESSHQLNMFLARLLFCFFAEDTGIFDKSDVFTEALANNTREDGSDMDNFLTALFTKLNTPFGQGDFPNYLIDFPHVNGGLFKDQIACPKFSRKARQMLIVLGELDWSEINPDIFGSMIQAVADPEERTNLGMHYTSVENILKVIKPLFLDDLYDEFEKNKENARVLNRLLIRLGKIKFFDPACGSGNFLIITYKELRNLEIQILKQLADIGSIQGKVYFTEISLDQFYGIEIKDFAHEMAILSLWLAEHQMNQVFEEELMGLGQSKPLLPLKEAGRITHGNAARMNWEDACPKEEGDEIYIIGNPPYLGYSRQDKIQKQDLDLVASKLNGYKKLDYIAIWFIKASDFIRNSNNKFAFVTTNSITQGEQVSLLFPYILENNKQEIFFCHQSFRWTNNAKGNAGVAVVIIGIRKKSSKKKFIYNKDIVKNAENINPYLIDYGNIYVKAFRRSISNLPKMIKGSSPGDNGNLLLEQEEKDKIILKNPKVNVFLRKYIGAREFMNNTQRYCIYVKENQIEEAIKIDELNIRFNKVRDFRLKSKKKATQKKSETPYFFDEDKHQESDFILIPQTGSERREYIPIGFLSNDYVPSNATRIIYNAESWLFGLLSSRMHIIWVKAVAGRLKTDMQYSNTICYNTFPFPEITEKQKHTINQYVFSILDERAKHSEKTMAWLYDPDTMPTGLRQAHNELDQAIERIYRLAPFRSDEDRLEYLFKLYDEMLKEETLFAKQKKKR